MIPSLGFTYAGYKFDNKSLFASSSMISLPLVAGHSYVSVASVITDYIKPKTIARLARGSNLGLHVMASIGFYKYIFSLSNLQTDKFGPIIPRF